MIPALIALAGMVGLGGGIAIGAAWVRTAGDTPTDEHPCTTSDHQHSWGQWEDCQLRSHWRWNANHTEYIPVLVEGQRRDCIGCGERQIRELKL